MMLFRNTWPEFAPVVQIPAPRLEDPELPSTPVIVNPSMTTLSARTWNAPFWLPTMDSSDEERPHPEIHACAPMSVRVFVIVTTSEYVPGSTRKVSPLFAAFTAVCVQGESNAPTPFLPP